MDCFVCSFPLQKSLFPVYEPQTREAFSILRCDQCGSGQTDPRPQDLSPYYSAYYGQRHGFSAVFCALRRLGWVRQMSAGRTGKLLDIGCGDGRFLQVAAHAGWQVAGIERFTEPARAAGFEVEQELSAMKERAPFDCITLWHSLEHLEAPQTVLRQVRELLAPQGVILIAVPNAQGWQARLFGSKWLHYDVPRHLYHFGPASLRALLQAENLEPLRWWHQEFEYDLLGWSQSALNSFLAKQNVFFNLLTGRSEGLSTWMKLINWVGGCVFSALALPLLPLSALFAAGGTVVVAARCANELTIQSA